MKTYGSIFQAETEGTICPVKESYYIRDAERVADLLLEGRGGGKGMDCWKLRVTICQNWINGRNGCRGRVLAMMLNSRYAFGNEYRF